jgi:hypothetical protein
LLAIVFSSVIQFIFPYRKNWREVLRNWRVNLPIAAINAVLLSLICGSCVCLLAAEMERRGWALLNGFQVSLGWRILASVMILDFVAYVVSG